MRFAWIRPGWAQGEPLASSLVDRALLVGYNLVWWIPVIAPVLDLVSYRTGFFGFLAITAVRAVVNLYRNNVMPIDKALPFPLRQP